MKEIIKNLSNKEYHQRDGLSKSKMDLLEISPAHYKASLEQPTKQTEALIFGSLFHTLVLEPERLEIEFAIEPKINKRTNEGKALYEQFLDINKDKTIITEEMLDKAKIMKESLLKNKIAKKLINAKGDVEISLFWTDKETKTLLKARPDKIVDNIIIDLKTALTANPNNFYKKAYDLGYHRQAYHFLTGYEECYGKKADGFIFIVIEKEPPYAVCCYKATDELLKIAKIEVRNDIELFANCEKTNTWNGYPEVLHDLDAPIWIGNKYLEDI